MTCQVMTSEEMHEYNRRRLSPEKMEEYNRRHGLGQNGQHGNGNQLEESSNSRTGGSKQVDAPRFSPFPIEALPNPIKRFCTEAAAAIGCDVSYLAVPALAALAGCIGNSNVIQLKHGWCEPSVVWAAIIGESGTTKSPALDAVLDPLHRAQREMDRQHKAANQEHLQVVAAYEADFAAWKGTGRKKGEPPPEKPAEPTCQRIIVNDTTVEALAVVLHENEHGVVLVRDELAGMLLSLNQYKSGKGADAQNFLSMHGARPIRIDRKGSTANARKTIAVDRAAVSILGGIQPMILQQCLHGEHTQDGLAARFLFAAPPAKTKSWTEAELSEAERVKLAELYRRLLALNGDVDDQGEPTPCVLPLTESGKATWISFYNQHAGEQAQLQGALASAYSKLEGGAARLALVVHLVRREWLDTSIENPGAIDGESVRAGVELSRWFCNEADRVYSIFAETDNERDQRELVEWITQHGVQSPRGSCNAVPEPTAVATTPTRPWRSWSNMVEGVGAPNPPANWVVGRAVCFRCMGVATATQPQKTTENTMVPSPNGLTALATQPHRNAGKTIVQSPSPP